MAGWQRGWTTAAGTTDAAGETISAAVLRFQEEKRLKRILASLSIKGRRKGNGDREVHVVWPRDSSKQPADASRRR